MREAANGSQLRRNFAGLDLLLVPEMFWDFSTSQVLVMERMTGVPISQVETLRSAGVDIKARAQASRSSSRRCSETASSTRTCTRATSR